MSIDLEGPISTLVRLTAPKYTQVAAIVLILWDYLLTIDSEVTYFWRGGWMWSKVLFLANRYIPILVTVMNTFVVFDAQITDHICDLWYRYIFIVASMIQIFIIQAILTTRLFAMYKEHPYILRCLLALYVTSMVAAVVALVLATTHDLDDAGTIFGMCLPESNAFQWVIWIPPLSFDIVAFVLAARRSWLYVYGTPFRGRTIMIQLLEVILRDSVIHFLLISLVYTMNALMLKVVPSTLQRLLGNLSLVAISILGTRMMINVKETGDNARSVLYISTLRHSR